MSTATLQPAAGVSLAGPQRTRWIISRRQDLIWFIGSALISYLALGLMSLGVGVALIQFIWFFGIDGPHVQSTITRTYFDKAERARLGWFLWIPVPLLLAGADFGVRGCWFPIFLVRGVLAAVPHRETALRLHDDLQGQEQGPHRFSAGSLAAAELAADPARHVRAAHAAGDHPNRSAAGVAANRGDRPVRDSGRRLAAAASAEAARGAADELAQAGTCWR